MISLNGFPVLAGSLSFTFRGTWVAMLDVGDGDVGDGSCVISDGTNELNGTIIYSGLNGARNSVSAIGGKGGMGNSVPASHYKGAKVSKVLSDICDAAGENVSKAIDKSITSQVLPFWSTPAGRCGTNLSILARHLGVTWGVDSGGGVLLGYDISSESDNEFEVLSSNFAAGSHVVAPEGFYLKPGMSQQDSVIQSVDYIIGSNLRATYYLK